MMVFEKFTNNLMKSDQIFNLSSFDLKFKVMPVQSILSENAFDMFLSRFCRHVRSLKLQNTFLSNKQLRCLSHMVFGVYTYL